MEAQRIVSYDKQQKKFTLHRSVREAVTLSYTVWLVSGR